MRKIFLLLVVLIGFNKAFAQQILTENFNYTSGQALTANGWTLNGFPPQNPINVVTPGLGYTGYVLSNVGNAAYVNATGMDVYQPTLTNVSSGSVYASFMTRIDTARTGDYCIGLLSSINPNTYFGRVYIKTSAAGFYRIGISKSTDTTVYSADSFPVRNVALIVVKYSFAPGMATNDSVSLFHFTSGFPSSEPIALLTTNGKGSQDATDVGRFALRQGTATTSPNFAVDGIRMAQNWNDLNTATVNMPGKLQFLFVNTITTTSAKINFVKPANYNSSLHTILVFLKKGATIAPGTPTANASSYLADTSFTGAGTPYQFDTAKCVFNGDTTFVTVGGLTPLTRYTVLGFAVSESDSLYSAATTTSFTTLSTAPSAAFGASFVATSKYSARVSWVKGTNYDPINHTQVVFIKELLPITTGINNMNPNLIFADTNFNGISTRYQFDTAARCIYNGDLTTVNVSGLKAGTRYYIMVLGVNVFDSAYSAASIANGTTPTGGPAVIVNPRFTGKLENNSTLTWVKPTGYVDSTYTVLIFMRKDTINQVFPSPVLNPISYLADSNFAHNPSRFENDTAAKCIYNGDGTSMGITNLTINTNYYFLFYIAKTDSGLYSLSTMRNGRTMVDSATQLKFTGTTSTTATISWTNPANFSAQYTTMVFVKAGSATNVGTPTRTVNRYTASANFGAGTKYQNDTQSFCVFRGNTNTVNITNLISGIDYYATVFIVRTADSVYTRWNTVKGATLGPPNVYAIGDMIHTNTTTGVLDSTGKRATLRGIVYGGNNRAVGTQFVLRDATGGISVLSNNKTFGYTAKEGDSIEVVGTITQVAGLNTISTLDTIKYFNGGHNIAKAKSYLLPDEYSENDLVIFQRVSFKTPIATWPAAGNVVVVNSYTGDTLTIRIYNTSGIGGTAAPTGEFSIAGMGGQQSSSNVAPFPFNGYYVAPRRLSDISLNTSDTISNFPMLFPASISTVDLGADTSTRFYFKSGRAKVLRGLGSVYYVCLFDESNGDFSLPIFGKSCDNGGLDTAGSISYGELLRNVPGLIPGDSVLLKITMTASFNAITKFADQERLVIFKLPKVTGLNSVSGNIDLLVYPNPAKQTIYVQCNANIQQMQLMDLQGKLLLSNSNENGMDVSEIPAGLYLLSVQTKEGIAVRKIQVIH